jgi:DedD protein
MSFFSFRRGRTPKPKVGSAAAAPESVEVVRKRARQRLIGSAVLVLLGVIGFPVLFDSQPRPVPVDIAIEIPSRSAIKPGSLVPAVPGAGTAAAPAPAVSAPALEPAPAQPVVPQASLEAKEEIVSGKAVNPTAPIASAPETAAKAGGQRSEGDRARELLEGKAAQAGTPEARVVVQVGAYGDLSKAREVRQKLEKAGFKTYTQVIDTKEGKRTRVRVGPFPSRSEAEQAAAKIKALDLPVSILAL